MKHYHPGYRRAKGIYTSLLEKVDECRASSTTRREGYYKFLEYMRERTDFRSSEALSAVLEGNANKGATVSEFEHGFIAPDFESFCAFVGRGKEFHKISVTFWFIEGIHLQRIQLFYHEEHGLHSFYFELEEAVFPPDDPDDGRNRRRRTTPPPAHSPRKSVLVDA